MGLLLVLLALAMLAIGIAATVFGAPIIQVERGWAMVIAGSVVATGGAVLLGVAVAVSRLGRIASELASVSRLAEDGALAAAPAVAVAAPVDYELEPADDRRPETPPARSEPPIIDVEPEPARPRRPPAEPPPPQPARSAPVPDPPPPPPFSYTPPEPEPAPVEVGRYSAGSNAYVIFADGSVQADTPTGRHRFASLDELRAFVAAGGEAGA